MANEAKADIKYLLEKVKEELLLLGYSKRTIKRYQTTWNSLIDYVEIKNVTSYTTIIGIEFLDETFKITVFKQLSGEDKVRARAINVLNDYYLHE